MWTDDAVFRVIVSGAMLAGIGMRIFFQARAARIGGAIVHRPDLRVFWVGAIALMPVMMGPVIAFLIDPTALGWTRLALPRAVRWVGAGITIGSIALIAWVFASLGENLTRT